MDTERELSTPHSKTLLSSPASSTAGTSPGALDMEPDAGHAKFSPALSHSSDSAGISGLDVMAHIASVVTPIPIVPRKSAAGSRGTVRIEQSSIIQSIYQHQQSLRQQQAGQGADHTAEAATGLSRLLPQPPSLPVLAPAAPQPQPQPQAAPAPAPALKAPQPRRRAPTPLSTTAAAAPSQRRVVHNVCERRRRENIRDGFDGLQSRLPHELRTNPRISKQDILEAGIKIIVDARRRVAALEHELAALEAARSRSAS